MAVMEDDPILDNMQYDAELEGFLTGKAPAAGTGMVNLQPGPTSIGASADEVPSGKMDGSTADPAGGAGAAAVAAGAAAAVGAAASALMGGKFGEANGLAGSAMAGAVGSMASAAVPTSLAPVKEKAGAFLAKAQPWKDFFIPISIPAGSDSCARVSANLFHFQTNYAILFVVQLVLAVVLQPSALVSIVVIVCVWIVFLKKNDDPDWHPSVGGAQLGPWQRWLALASITGLVMLFMCGNTIFSAAFFYIFLALVHGILHDSSNMGLPGGSDAYAPPSSVPVDHV